MSRKGVALNLMLIIMVLLGAYQIMFVAMVGMSGVRVGVRRYQEDIYSLQNSLDSGKEYLDTALRYSSYQACYDILESSGWPDFSDFTEGERKQRITVIGDESYATLPQEGIFKAGLETKIMNNMNTYSTEDYGFMGVFSVDLPRYSSIKIENPDNDNILIRADSDDMIEITKYKQKLKVGEGFLGLQDSVKQEMVEEVITLKKESGLEETVQTPCYSLFLKAQKKSQELSEAIKDVLKSELEDLTKGVAPNRGGTCDYIVVAESADDIKERLKKGEVEVFDAGFHAGVRDGLVSGDIEVRNVTLTFAELLQSSDANGNEICLLTKGRAVATLKTSVKGPADQTFPVWNGQELAFEPLELTFIVKGEYSSD
jgi:hypothetical protein